MILYCSDRGEVSCIEWHVQAPLALAIRWQAMTKRNAMPMGKHPLPGHRQRKVLITILSHAHPCRCLSSMLYGLEGHSCTSWGDVSACRGTVVPLICSRISYTRLSPALQMRCLQQSRSQWSLMRNTTRMRRCRKSILSLQLRLRNSQQILILTQFLIRLRNSQRFLTLFPVLVRLRNSQPQQQGLLQSRVAASPDAGGANSGCRSMQ